MTSRFILWLSIVSQIAVVVLLVSSVVVTVRAYQGSHQTVEIPLENRTRFAQVAVVIDGTHSVQRDFPAMKRAVQAKIIPYLGFGDTVRCYEVQPDFDPIRNLVFGDLEEQPQITENQRVKILAAIRGQQKKPGIASGTMRTLIQDMAPRYQRLEELRKIWSQKVAKLRLREDRGSNICDPLLNLSNFLREGDAGAEKWLFVLSDFRHEPPGPACNAEQPFPKDAHIVWIYPFRSGGPRWQELADFWRPLLGDQEPERVSLDALMNRNLLDPNPMTGFESYHPKTWWDCARPLLLPTLRLDGLLIAIGAIIAALIVFKSAFPPPASSRTGRAE